MDAHGGNSGRVLREDRKRVCDDGPACPNSCIHAPPKAPNCVRSKPNRSMRGCQSRWPLVFAIDWSSVGSVGCLPLKSEPFLSLLLLSHTRTYRLAFPRNRSSTNQY